MPLTAIRNNCYRYVASIYRGSSEDTISRIWRVMSRGDRERVQAALADLDTSPLHFVAKWRAEDDEARRALEEAGRDASVEAIECKDDEWEDVDGDG